MTEPTLYPEGGFRRLRIDLAYDGTNFSGWGRQPDRRTVQQTVEEAIATGATELAVACPFCRVMTSDGMNAKESKVEVLDVAQVLLRSVKEI